MAWSKKARERAYRLIDKVCMECGEVFECAYIHRERRVRCPGCQAVYSRDLDLERKRVEPAERGVCLENGRSGHGRGSRWGEKFRVVSCPGDEWPLGAVLFKADVTETLKRGYFPPGLVFEVGNARKKVVGETLRKQRLKTVEG